MQDRFTLYNLDCLDAMEFYIPDNSVDAIVTDPPYGLSFMGKKWDYDVPDEAIWRECLRVLKPGGHLLAFAGTRTQHRMAVRIEDAGFEIRDMIFWCYGSGFPKSLDVSKAIDKAAGAEREVVGSRVKAGIGGSQTFAQDAWTQANRGPIQLDITAPATESARQWQGWGTALKPALEPITVARKPLVGTVAANVLEWGTGALNIDGCRVGTESTRRPTGNNPMNAASGWNQNSMVNMLGGSDSGRWPANFIHDGSEEVVAGFPVTGASKAAERGTRGRHDAGSPETERRKEHSAGTRGHDDNGGSAARFFYCAKASKRDRDEGLDGFTLQAPIHGRADQTGNNKSLHISDSKLPRANIHPTVKPTDLMAYLCRLVTPPGGVVLDPFMGSGSTGKAAILEGFQFVGIERDAEYHAIAQARIEAALK